MRKGKKRIKRAKDEEVTVHGRKRGKGVIPVACGAT